MTTTEILREEVREYIEHADDKSLRLVKAILEIELEDGSEDWWDELPGELQALIETGIKEGEEGKGISHDEMRKKHARWLKK